MKICNEDRWMSIFISHSPQLHHQMSCCVWPTVSNQNIITLTRLSIKLSHLRGWNHWMLIISAQKITEITIWLRKQLLIYFLLTDQTSSKWHVLYLSDQLGSEFWCTISTLWTKKHYINLIISTEKTVQLVLFFATFGQQNWDVITIKCCYCEHFHTQPQDHSFIVVSEALWWIQVKYLLSLCSVFGHYQLLRIFSCQILHCVHRLAWYYSDSLLEGFHLK